MSSEHGSANCEESGGAMSTRTKMPLLIAATIASIAIGALSSGEGIAKEQKVPQSVVAYGGHNFDRSTNEFQDERQVTTVAFMISSRRKLERRQQLRFATTRAVVLGSGLSSGDDSCGRGRYRDATSGKCRGPADVSLHL
jgi:hypothetical protein